MGQAVSRLVAKEKGLVIAAGFDRSPRTAVSSYPVYRSFAGYNGEADVAIDFSHPSFLAQVLAACVQNNIALVVATTGQSLSQLKAVEYAAQKIPVLLSPNLSLGMNVMKGVLETISARLGKDFDVEIIEKHHGGKADSPSGTAYLLAETVNEASGNYKRFIFGRKGNTGRRPQNEIGIHSVRCGALPGEHTVIFAGPDEILEVKHTALSRDTFARGAIRAAGFLAQAKPGLYTMTDVLRGPGNKEELVPSC